MTGSRVGKEMGEAGPLICPNENSLKESGRGRRLREEMCRR